MPSSLAPSGDSGRRTIVPPSGSPSPVGPYSAGVEAGGWLFLSGQIALEATGKIVAGGVEAEVRLIFENLGRLLQSAGYSPKDVVKLTLYMTDLEFFQVANQACSIFFEKPYPARTTVQVAALPKGAQIEIDAIAFRSEGGF